jgi:hypothetical protein
MAMVCKREYGGQEMSWDCRLATVGDGVALKHTYDVLLSEELLLRRYYKMLGRGSGNYSLCVFGSLCRPVQPTY